MNNKPEDFARDLDEHRSDEPCKKCNGTGFVLLDNYAVGGTESDAKGLCECKGEKR